jgi:hypothetical protein
MVIVPASGTEDHRFKPRQKLRIRENRWSAFYNVLNIEKYIFIKYFLKSLIIMKVN